MSTLNASERLDDLRIPPGNRLEKLSGKRAGQYSIRINEIVHGKRAISADTALRLSRYFGLSERFWINLQAHYDLEVEKDSAEYSVIDKMIAQIDNHRRAQMRCRPSNLIRFPRFY